MDTKTMFKTLTLALALCLISTQALAGFLNITPGQWATFNSASTNGAKSTQEDAAGEPAVDVVCLSVGEEMQVQTIVPQTSNPASATWVFHYKWNTTSVAGVQDACITVTNVVCLDGDDCKNLAFANGDGTAELQEDVTTAGILISDDSGTFALEAGDSASDCSASNCDGFPVWFKFVRNTAGACTEALDADLCFVSTVLEYAE